MIPPRRSVLAVAAAVWDQDSLSEADTIFLDAISEANRAWSEALTAANREFGGGSDAWRAVQHLATRQRDSAFERPLAAFEANDHDKIMKLAAEGGLFQLHSRFITAPSWKSALAKPILAVSMS